MTEKGYTYKNAVIRLCLDRVGPKMTVDAKLYSLHKKEGVPFHDFPTLLMEVEKILDIRGFPSACCQLREFTYSEQKNFWKEKAPIYYSIEEFNRKRGEIATYYLYITSRKNVTWKGYIVSSYNGEVKNFDSELELMQLWKSEWIAYYEERELLKQAL